MNRTRQFLCLALLASGGWAAEPGQPPRLDLGYLSGVPTPLEEYGLSIGDITVTRVINPLGQLTAGSPVMLSRRLKTITNPWTDLTSGTALVVGGKKAVIQQIQPAEPDPKFSPNDTPLTVTLTVKEIAGERFDLEWEQKTLPLNDEIAPEGRRMTVRTVKRFLRVGSQLIIGRDRKVVTERTFSYAQPDSTSDAHLRLELKLHDGTTLTGQPTTSEKTRHRAWDLFGEKQASLAGTPVYLVTWDLKRRVGADTLPDFTILHRTHGLIQKMELEGDKHVRAHARFKQKGHSQVRVFHWTAQVSPKGQSWPMKPGPEEFRELFHVNDTNIRFKVTPTALEKANEDSLKFFRQRKHNVQMHITPGNIDAETLQKHIEGLKRIIDSDTSQSLKIDAKRQAVIHLARYYEHSALAHHALAREYLARAQFKIQRARVLEQHAWANGQKLSHLRAALFKKSGATLSLTKPEPGQAQDLEVEPWIIADLEADIEKFKLKLDGRSDNELKQEHPVLLRKLTEQNARAARLRLAAGQLREQATHRKNGVLNQARLDYLKALQFWTEYIHRTEGIAADARTRKRTRLSEPGVGSNIPPPDPFIPEILLRQAWIYRQLGQPERAIDKLHDVLKSATVQKIDNLTRFGRIYLVARSQIADTYARDAQKQADHDAAIDKFEVLLNTAKKDLAGEPEELNLDGIQLKLLRTLSRVNAEVRAETRLLQLRRNKLQTQQLEGDNPDDASVFIVPKLEKIQGQINRLNQRREAYWEKMADHASKFITRNGERDADGTHVHSGEVRYYQIIAHKALGRHDRVQNDLEVLLSNASTPVLQRQAWATTRVRVMIDIANLLFNDGARRMNTNLDDAKKSIEGAMGIYRWALKNDQTYRSQILIRQQIGFCHERLDQIPAARDSYDQIVKLCEMHPVDVRNNPAVRVTRDLTKFRLRNLNHQIKQQKNTQP